MNRAKKFSVMVFASCLALTAFAQEDRTVAAVRQIDSLAAAYAAQKAAGGLAAPSGPMLQRAKAAFVPNVIYPLLFSSKQRMNGSLSDWDDIPFTGEISQAMPGMLPQPEGFRAWFKAAISEDSLYLLCVAHDKKLNFACPGASPYDNDCFELFLDPLFKRDFNHDDTTSQSFISYKDKAQSELAVTSKLKIKTVPVKLKDEGWGFEAEIPLRGEYFKATPFDGLPIGFNISYCNNENGRKLEAKSMWSKLDAHDSSWVSPSVFGVLRVLCPEPRPVVAVKEGEKVVANREKRSAGETLANPGLLGKERPTPEIVRGFCYGGTRPPVARELGANVLRYSLTTVFDSPKERQEMWHPAKISATLDKIDETIGRLQAEGLKVIPIGPFPCDRWDSPELAKTIQDTWRKIAQRLASRKDAIWGYDIVNEPLNSRDLPYAPAEWRDLAIGIVKAIREVDQDSWIIYEVGPGGGYRGFEDLKPLPDPHIIYSFHMYEPGSFTHQRIKALELQDPALLAKAQESVVKYPAVIDGILWNRATLERRLKIVSDFQHKWNVPIYVGEFSAVAWAPEASTSAYLRDVLDIFEKNGWSWTYHNTTSALENPNARGPSRMWLVDAEQGVYPEGGLLKRVEKETERSKILREFLAKNAQGQTRP